MIIELLTHSTGIKGPGDFLEDYLLNKKNEVYKLEHPLDVYQGRSSIFTKNKTIIWRKNRSNHLLIFNLLFDALFNITSILCNRPNCLIGVNNFDTVCAVFARIVLRQKILKIIYFSSDFSDYRYNSKILNFIYSLFERAAIAYSDITISNTFRAEKMRLALGLKQSKSIVIPNGFSELPQAIKPKKIDKYSFIYVGNVTREHGLVDLLKQIQPIIKKLVVIGQGDQWSELNSFIRINHIDATLYYAKDHSFVIQQLKRFSGFGLAPYNTTSSWTRYASPLKIIEYVCCGIPVITTDVTEISDEIINDSLGIVVKSFDLDRIQKEIKQFDVNKFYAKSQYFNQKYNINFLYKKIPI